MAKKIPSLKNIEKSLQISRIQEHIIESQEFQKNIESRNENFKMFPSDSSSSFSEPSDSLGATAALSSCFATSPRPHSVLQHPSTKIHQNLRKTATNGNSLCSHSTSGANSALAFLGACQAANDSNWFDCLTFKNATGQRFLPLWAAQALELLETWSISVISITKGI